MEATAGEGSGKLRSAVQAHVPADGRPLLRVADDGLRAAGKGWEELEGVRLGEYLQRRDAEQLAGYGFAWRLKGAATLRIHLHDERQQVNKKKT
mmetsp:Transcript_86380/g.230744  ORF Transcript_86380/g.230744 Transcript_86380/m.230744 type:complete len:94 (+) Transcript_86380:371-652(+)